MPPTGHLLPFRKVLRPVSRGITKRGSGQSSREICPRNSFAETTGEAEHLPRAEQEAALREVLEALRRRTIRAGAALPPWPGTGAVQ